MARWVETIPSLGVSYEHLSTTHLVGFSFVLHNFLPSVEQAMWKSLAVGIEIFLVSGLVFLDTLAANVCICLHVYKE